MIKLFAYENNYGTKSIKIIGVVGENSTNFNGISLGKVLFNSDFTLDEVLDDLANTPVLDHIPGRGEGLTQYGSCSKTFKKSNIYCQLGELDPAKITAAELEKTIRFVKQMPESEQNQLADTLDELISSGTRWTDPSYISHLPTEIVEVIAVAGTKNSASAAQSLMSGVAPVSKPSNPFKFPYVIIKQVDDGSWWYEGADKTLKDASRVLFYMAKEGGHMYEMAEIVYLRDQDDLDELRDRVNNLPKSL